MAGRGDTGKSSSVTADKAGAGGRHGGTPEQREGFTGQRETPASDSSGVQGDNKGREASGVAHKSLVVGDEEGGCEASEVAENPRKYRQGVGGVQLSTGH